MNPVNVKLIDQIPEWFRVPISSIESFLSRIRTRTITRMINWSKIFLSSQSISRRYRIQSRLDYLIIIESDPRFPLFPIDCRFHSSFPERRIKTAIRNRMGYSTSNRTHSAINGSRTTKYNIINNNNNNINCSNNRWDLLLWNLTIVSISWPITII